MRFPLIFILLSFVVTTQAQVLTPVKWSYATSIKDARVGDEVDLIFKAAIDKDWYLYSSEFPCEDPIKTSFSLTPNSSFQLIGGIQAINPIDKYDEIFECDVKVFKKTAEFRQRIKVLSANLKISGESDYQVCSDVTGQCVPGGEDFSFASLVVSSSKPEGQPQQNNPDTFQVVTPEQPVLANQPTKGPILDPALVKEDPQGKSLLSFLFISFLAGLAALITPCVFPMIPMTVSFFTGRGTKFQALMYGFFIILIYSLIGAALAPLMGPETANHLSTEWIPNLIFFLVFIVFGLSFLGLFEITLPGSLINKVDQQAEKGGLIGVFFMAFTLVLVSFSCTGPIVGSILVSSAGGEFLKPIAGMFAFALAFAIPFTLFAFFPNWL
ncbi:MAG: disulfide bond formation protein DsbD, partial [Cyclobacteriaceae bacterium]|nr:disulfide bond formation protein DsbD [Cyclobacteriaceae bacterium]